MSPKKPNQAARLLAIITLLGAFLVVAVLIVNTGSPSEDLGDIGPEQTTTQGNTPSDTPKIRKALSKGVYTVEPGDTLTSIAEATAVEVGDLIDLNPEVDAQALIAGQKIRLR